MSEAVVGYEQSATYPVSVHVQPAVVERNRLTTFFRFFLAIPHILLVGGPAVVGTWFSWRGHGGVSWGTGAGVLGAVACVVAFIAWFAILFTGRYPHGLWKMAAFYMRWRLRAISYMTLLRDEYPPFGDDPYPAELVLPPPDAPRDRLTVFFRLPLAIPHLILLAILGVLWAFTTAVAWAMILITGRFPETLYGFALGVLAWSTRVEAYILLLRDEYPPFSLRV
jgi:hypothetical protein